MAGTTVTPSGDKAEFAPIGYSSAKVTRSVVVAVVLHVLILGAYFSVGMSSHKPAVEPAKAAAGTAVDTNKGADAGKAPATGANDKAPAKSDAVVGDAPKKTEAAAPKADTNSSDVAKPGEIPKRPDSDIDDLFKQK